MNWTDRSLLLVRKFSGWMAYLIVLFIVAEVMAGYALNVYRDTRLDLTDWGSISEDVYEELSFVQENALPSVYRWYSLYPNFKGQHIITDNSGFRIDVDAIDGRKKVGMFGGSTTFSVLTDQRGTISEQASSEKYQILNFGIGGYSTSAEIMTLVEAIRVYPDIKIAIFYDGVNELGTAKNTDEKGTDINSPESLMGHPFDAVMTWAFENADPTDFSFRRSNLYYIYSRINEIIKDGYSKEEPLRDDDFINSIVKRYYANLKVIKGICDAHAIQCLFTWQPSIYTVPDDKLTPDERIKKNSSYAEQYYTKLTNAILASPMANKFKVIDLTHSLDAKKSQIFADWHHLNSKGNKLVAEALKGILHRIPESN
jgi:hypothetical protein